MPSQRAWTVTLDTLGVPGVTVGVVTRPSGTGVTVILLPPGCTGAVDVRGGAPATRETDALDPGNRVEGPDAVLLAGGSAFGLRAADGVMVELARRGRGVAVGRARVPIVVGAALFDLSDPPDPPTAEDGAAALRAAWEGGLQRASGRLGAGAGARVGRAAGASGSTPSGQGLVSLHLPSGLMVGALAVVNAVGGVRDAAGQWMAGPRAADGTILDATHLLLTGAAEAVDRGQTTLVMVVSNARLNKAEAHRAAVMAHDGMARAIEPCHTTWDGDIVFVAATGGVQASGDTVGILAAEAVALAVRRAVTGAP